MENSPNNVETLKPANFMMVTKPIKKDGLKAYIVYTVVASKLIEPIYKRFSDFYALREKLVERWPGIYIPNIPHKKMVVNISLIRTILIMMSYSFV